jgi:hypothetical protein
MPDTWVSRDLPVLKVIVDAFEENPNGNVRLEQLEKLTGLSREELGRSLAALDRARPPFFSGTMVNGLSYPIIISEVTERALVATEQWPKDDAYRDLLQALDEAIEEAPPEEKGRLKKLREAVTETSKEVVAEIISRVIERKMGM